MTATAAATDDLTGRTLGDFVVRHRIGEGGFGAVYRAEQPALGREAVIKVLHARFRASKPVIQRFLREARLASRLDHPYAAHIYAFGAETDGLMWIAMEYVRGQTLHEVLKAKGAMTPEELLPLLDRICEVLQAAHDLGIVHRDIKPPNVMVVQRSGRAFPKLLDFGIAKLSTIDETTPAPAVPVAPPVTAVTRKAEPATDPGTDGTVSFVGVLGGGIPAAPVDGASATVRATSPAVADGPELTEAGAAIGSPPYMAPEQWDDSSAATPRTDLYALGILTYEALAGRRPFTGSTFHALAIQHATEALPAIGGPIPRAVEAVLAKALAKDPADRYANALEFAAAFRLAAGFGEPPLPALDDDLRVSIEASFPQPIAEAVAAFHAARNAHQARDAMRDLVTICTRYLALLALASYSQHDPRDAVSADAIADALRELHRGGLSDEGWLRLARAALEPFRSQRDVLAIPALVDVLLPQDPTDDVLGTLAATAWAQGEPLERVRAGMPLVTRMLRSLAFLADHPLVVVTGDRAEAWTGLRRARRIAVEVQGGMMLEPGQPAVLDPKRRPALVLWPLVQVSAPLPDAPPELFLFDGRGRRGARLVALPQPLERQDEALWEWLVTRFARRESGEAVMSGSGDAAPFRGLAAFTADHAEQFIGREREIEAALNRLRVAPFVAVVGPSGAGKSSLVHAGIVPSLPAAWTVIGVRPGATPLATLEVRLRRAGIEPVELHGRGETLVIVVDQFEELFTLGASIEEQRAYVRLLLGAAQTPDDRVRVIFTLRDDFLARATQLPELRERLAAALFLLGTPSRGELLRILREPLARIGYRFEDDALAERIVREVEDSPSALPLVSFTAHRLWELRDRQFRQLTRRAYESLGGVVGALAQHAEGTLDAMSANEQRLARTALSHLVTAEGTRAVLSRKELVELMDDEHAAAVLEKLIAARLLTATESEGGDDSIEVAHEALLVAWPRLATWRREDAEGARLRDQLRAAARQWQDRERPRGLLWRDDALAELKLWRARNPAKLTETDEAFIAASLAEAARGRRWRQGIVATVLALIAVAFGVLVWARNNAARTATRERERALRETLEVGRQALLAGNSRLAREKLAEARAHGAPDTAALRFLETMAQRPTRGQTATLRGHTALVNHVEFSPDSKQIVTSSADGTARLWDAATSRPLLVLAGCHGVLLGASFDPTGHSIAAECDDGVVRLYGSDGQLRHELAMARTNPYTRHQPFARFSPDGTRLATALLGVVEMWDVESGRRLWATPGDQIHGRIAFAPDGKLVASMSTKEPIVTLWAADSGAPARVLHLDSRSWATVSTSFSALAFDRTGAQVFTVANETQLVEIWDVATGQRLDQLETRAGKIGQLRVDPGGTRIALASRNHAIQLWSLGTKTLERTFAIGNAQVLDLAFSADGERLAGSLTNGSVEIWDLRSGAVVADLQGHVGAASAVAFAGVDELVTAGADGIAIRWSVPAAVAMNVTPLDDKLVQLESSGERFLVATERSVTVRTASTGEIIAQRVTGPATARFADDHTIVIADDPGKIWAWDLSTDTARELARLTMPPTELVSNHAGVTATIAGNELVLADAHSGEVFRWKAPANIVPGAFAFRRGRELAVADEASNVHFLAEDGHVERTLHVDGRINTVSSLPDGRVLTASPHVVQLWSEHGDLIERITEGNSEILWAAVDHAGARAVTVGLDGTTRIWSLLDGKPLAELSRSSLMYAMAFSDDDQLLATVDSEGNIQVWSAPTGDELFRFVALHERGLIAFAGHAIVASDLLSLVTIPVGR